VSRALERAWLTIAVAFVAALVWHHMTMRGDTFWSLAGGEWVLSHHSYPARDPFAFTTGDAPFVLTMPVFQIGSAWLVDHLGLRSMTLACALAIAAGACVLWLSSARSFAGRIVCFGLVLFYVELDAEDISARGQAFGDLAFAILLLLLFRVRRGARFPWLAFLALGAVWANFHPSFLIAAVLPLGFAVAECLEPAADRAPRSRFVLAGLLALLGALVTPQPIALVLDAVTLLTDPTTAHVDLFSSPDFHRPLWLLAPASGVALAALRANRGDPRGRAADAALLLVFVAATCLARRYGTLLVALEIAVAGPLLDRELPRPPSLPRVPLGLAALGLLVAAVAFACETKDPLALVPAGAVAAIDRLDAPDRVVHPYYWGGYLEWAWGGRRKAFIDGRNHYFANGTFDDAYRLEQLAGWSDVLDAYEARTVLWVRHAPLDEVLARDPRWAVVYTDAMAVVYVRR
jgi:hypothetical protein